MTGPLWTIRVETWINAPVARCFEVALYVEQKSDGAGARLERAVAGAMNRRRAEGDEVTRESRLFGRKLRYATRVEQVRPSTYFREVRVSGPLSRYEHEHHFAAMDDGTRMRDEIVFSVPLGVVGRVATRMFIRKRLASLLRARSQEIKRLAESGDDWNQTPMSAESVVRADFSSVEETKGKKGWRRRPLLRESRG